MARYSNKIGDIRRETPFHIFVEEIGRGRTGLIVEGDSWVANPTRREIKHWLDASGRYTTQPFYGYPGKLLREMALKPYFLGYLKDRFAREHIKCVLLSGGGNDFLMEKVLKRIIRRNGHGASPESYINAASHRRVLGEMKRYLERIITSIRATGSKVPIVTHTYAYPVPGDRPADFHPPAPIGLGMGPWLHRVFRPEANNVPEEMWDAVTKRLVDAYYDVLSGLEQRFAEFHVVDLRRHFGESPRERRKAWGDEIHLTDPAYKDITAVLMDKIEDVRLR